MRISLKRISRQHERLFPLATAESQFYKLEEEIKQFEKADTYEQRLKERADILIVSAGLYRWFPKTAESVAELYWWNGIEKEVNRKWKVNLKRTWEWNGQTYKHVGKDGNE